MVGSHASSENHVTFKNLLAVAGSAALCMEMLSHHNRLPMQCWFKPQSLVLHIPHFSLD
jgi:hypothetical protein